MTKGTNVVRFNPATVTLLEMKEDKSLEPLLSGYIAQATREEKQKYLLTPGSIRGEARPPGHGYTPSRPPRVPLHCMESGLATFTTGIAFLRPCRDNAGADKGQKDIPVQMLLGLHSQHLVRFNGALAIRGLRTCIATIAPPTSIVKQIDLLKLLDNFAKGRKYSDDDPNNQLDSNGIEKRKTSSSKPTAPWDLFPAARNLTHIWDMCQDFVRAFMGKYYPTDDTVRKDDALQKWMAIRQAGTGQYSRPSG